MFLPSRQRRLNLAQTPDRVEVQPSLTRRGNIRQPSRGLKPTAKFKAPRCGGGICEVNPESRLHIFPKRLKQSSIRRLLFKIKMDKVESEYRQQSAGLGVRTPPIEVGAAERRLLDSVVSFSAPNA